MSQTATDLSSKEIRLGLVCYGGVSLAIYMHGVTKELHKLVRAARAFDTVFDDGPSLAEVANPFRSGPAATRQVGGAPDCDSEAAYFDALVALARAGRPLTVVLDVIAGTSAGGINGVVLGRGMAQGLSLNTFKSLWIDEADMNVLLSGHAVLPFGQKARLLSRIGESVIRLGWHPEDGVLNGNLMSNLLQDALLGMVKVEDSLVRSDESLDLITTTTNVYGYDTAVPTGAGGPSHTDHSYRQLLHFHYDVPAELDAAANAPDPALAPGRFASDFGDGSVPALAFAARATSSFPGAFQAVSLPSFAASLKPPGDTAMTEQIAEHFVYGLEYGAKVEDQWFMDGGVLDNGPFDVVIDAIAQKRAAGQTARELLYLEPDPGGPLQQARPEPQPTAEQTVWAARLTIPQHTPLVGMLEQLRLMNEAIAEVGAIVTAQEDTVAELLGAAELDGAASYEQVSERAVRVRATAQQETGLGYATYCRLRAEAVGESIALTVAEELGFPPQSNRAAFVAASVGAWVRDQKMWTSRDPEALDQALSPVDFPFRIRRTEFVLQGLNDLLATTATTEPMRQQLVTMKAQCWQLLTWLRSAGRQVAAAIKDQAAALFGQQSLDEQGVLIDPAVFVGPPPAGRQAQFQGLYDAYRAAAEQLKVTGSSRALWESFTAHTTGWEDKAKAQLLARYVGFPIWDAVIYPVIALAQLPQLSPITVQRLSPLDATCLKAVTDRGELKAAGSEHAKLDGVAIDHFGGFFESQWRRNDYIWGRLDGAEFVLRLLTRHATSNDTTGSPPPNLVAYLREALSAILTAEQPTLHIDKIINALLEQVAQISDDAFQGPGSVPKG